MGVLAAIDEWPVQTAAAAVVGTAGLLDVHGRASTQFPLASVTKPLAALAMLIAVEEEAVALDTAADEQLLPGATLRHLLAHASGIAPDARARIAAPGQRRNYSNAGFELAAEIVELATGMAFAQYFAEAVAAPLEMSSTELAGSPARDGVSTVDDLVAVLQELLAPTGLLSAPMGADLATVQFSGLRGVLPGFGPQDPNDWGLGFEIRGDKSPHWTGATNSPATYGHFGQSGTMLWIDPVAGLGLVVLTDEPFGDWARSGWPELADAVVAEY